MLLSISQFLYRMENATTSPAQHQIRYRGYLIEKLHYTVDVLAKDEDEARELALESEYRSEAECTLFDAEEIVIVPKGDKTFHAGNACMKCGARIKEEMYPHCSGCIEKIKKAYGKAA